MKLALTWESRAADHWTLYFLSSWLTKILNLLMSDLLSLPDYLSFPSYTLAWYPQTP
jgi:hypothetical protein